MLAYPGRAAFIVDEAVTVTEDELGARTLGDLVRRGRRGAVGLAKISESRPDVITLDLMMPVMDGWEFLRRYRQPVSALAPILVMSPASESQLALLEGCAVLAKPFDMHELLAVVARLALPGH